MNKYFHFTLGPVQGFVAQARRTRDFWAGSFILSWLSAVAMRAVIAQNGEIISPKPNENFFAWLEGKGTELKPRQGKIPNRFTAKINDDFEPDKIEQSVQKAWYELADLVWQDLDKAIAYKTALSKTAEIWNRQVDHFWEISWALTEDNEEFDLLDRRKNLRNHFAPDEFGVKCTVMEGWQELSGTSCPNKKELRKFWQPIQAEFKRDLAKNEDGVYENLCAIAFIKRRFADCFKKLGAIKPIEMPDGWKLKGWDFKIGVPSVSFMAAIPWLKKVIATEDISQLKNLVSLANELGGGNQDVSIQCIKKALETKNLVETLQTSDGDVFFENELNNKNKYPQNKADKMREEVLQKIAIKPSPFYAILLMDGDSLGSKMGDVTNRTDISAALHAFTNEVSDKVEDNNGFLIYAGGDDVLAILPVPHALQCAADIRQIYQEAFQDKDDDVKNSTISAAIEFVHTHTPLTTMLKDAHNLLDDVAKDGCGRNAVAVRVWKRGGKALEWAMPWEIALDKNQFIVEKLVVQFQNDDFSSKFLYKIREHFDLLNPSQEKEDETLVRIPTVEYLNLSIDERFKQLDFLETEQQPFTRKDSCTLLATDYFNSELIKKLSIADAEDKIAPLLEQCWQIKRIVPDNDTTDKGIEKIGFLPQTKADAVLLIRFLAKEGMKCD